MKNDSLFQKKMSKTGHMVCKIHAPQAGKYADHDPKNFLNKLVKIPFKAFYPETGKETKEHMWVRVQSVNEDLLVGILDNDPMLMTGYVFGDAVKFQTKDIEDLLP